MQDLITIPKSNIEVIRRTIAKDLNENEFDLYIALAKRTGLDPFRRQIIPIVFNARKPEARKMETIVTRDGNRCIASRCGNYRPKEKPANFIIDKDLISETNPAGIISCSVEIYLQDRQGVWHPVSGEAYWEEFAPIEKEWKWGDQKGQKVYTGAEKLTGNWGKMPRVMLEKCAESAALRAGWPEEFTGFYSEEEMAKAILNDQTASEELAQELQERRERAVNYNGKVPANFGEGIIYIPTGEYGDRWLEKLDQVSPQIGITLKDQNRECLNEYWSKDPDGALALKQKFEQIEAKITPKKEAAE